MSVARDAYLKRMAELKRHSLAETALDLVDSYVEADAAQRQQLGRDLVNEFYRVLTQVWGWKPYEARFATQILSRSFKEVRS